MEREIAEQRYYAALTHAGIWIQVAIDRQNFDEAHRALAVAHTIESKLSSAEADKASIRTWEALLARSEKRPASEVLSLLIAGAKLWFEKLAGRFQIDDFINLAGVMHDHFRLLALQLLELDRNEEAFVAFEVGRSLGQIALTEPQLFEDVLDASIFNSTAGKINVEIIKQLQRSLSAPDGVLSIAAFPGRLTAFVVRSDRLSVVHVHLAEEDVIGDRLIGDLFAIPARLDAGRGVSSLPEDILKLGSLVASELRDATLRAVAPWGPLHSVPWRTLFRHAGIPWSGCGVEFTSGCWHMDNEPNACRRRRVVSPSATDPPIRSLWRTRPEVLPSNSVRRVNSLRIVPARILSLRSSPKKRY